MDEKESTITFKTWGLITLVVVIFGFFFLTVLAHENRLTRVETTLEVNIAHMTKSLDVLAGKIEQRIYDKK